MSCPQCGGELVASPTVHCPTCAAGMVTYTIPVSLPSSQDARAVGQQIRELLLALRHPNGGYSTDQLRAEALQYAGFCWLAPGELAPECACDWDPATDPA